MGFAGLTLFGLVNAVRAYVQYKCYFLDLASEEPIHWFTSFAMLSVTGLVVSAFGFSGCLYKYHRLINHIGSRMFYVYLFHFVILLKLNGMGINARLYELLVPKLSPFAYELSYVFIVFVLAYILSELFMLFLFIAKKVKIIFPAE